MDDHVGHIAQAWPELRVLKLSDCCLCGSLRSIAAGLRHLDVLEIARTEWYSDVEFHDMCINLAATLRHLNVTDCASFTITCAHMVATTLINLQWLEARNTPLTDADLLQFARMNRSLRYLNIAPTRTEYAEYEYLPFTNDTIQQFKNLLPACNIIHEV